MEGSVLGSSESVSAGAAFMSGVGADPDFTVSCSWLPLDGASVKELLVIEKEGFSSVLTHSSWGSVWLLWFCWPLWGHIVGAVGQFCWAHAFTVLSGSFLTVSVPMWFTSPEAEADGVFPGFSLFCSSACLQESEALLQSTGPLGG